MKCFLGVVGRGGSVGGPDGSVGLGLGVDGNALVGNIGDVSVVVVGGVLDVLGPAVGEGHGVGAGDVAGAVSGLVSGESGLGVVVGNAVGVSVGSGLLLVGGSVGGGMVGGGGGVVGGSVGNGVDGGSVVDNGGGVGSGVVDGVSHGVSYDGVGGSMVSHESVVSQGSVVSNNSVVSQRSVVRHNSVVSQGSVDGVSHDTVTETAVDNGTVGGRNLGQTLGVVNLVHGGVAGSEGLGDLDGPDLTVSLGDGLVGGLTGRGVAVASGAVLRGSRSHGKKGGHAHESL